MLTAKINLLPAVTMFMTCTVIAVYCLYSVYHRVSTVTPLHIYIYINSHIYEVHTCKHLYNPSSCHCYCSLPSVLTLIFCSCYPNPNHCQTEAHYHPLLTLSTHCCCQLLPTISYSLLSATAYCQLLPTIRHCLPSDTAYGQTLPTVRHCLLSDTAYCQILLTVTCCLLTVNCYRQPGPTVRCCVVSDIAY